MATISSFRPQGPGQLHSRGAIRLLGRAAGLWHLASFDAPTVAVVWTLAFASAAHLRLPGWPPAALALAAWSVYLCDRLLDAGSARTPLRARHHFHWRHRRVLIPAAILAALASLAILVGRMPQSAARRNSMLAAAALAYFASVHLGWPSPMARVRWLRGFRLPKELMVGVLFTVACASPTWARAASGRAQLVPPTLCFIALAWLNCHAIETWESASRSAAQILWRPASLLAGLCLAAAAGSLALHQGRIAALLAAAALSAGLLALLDRLRPRLTPLALRTAADLVLLTPLLLAAA